MSKTEYVFVYGTLRLGGHANHLMQQSGKFLEFATTLGTMYDLGAFPGITLGGDSQIVGEVWAIRPDAIPALDRYEGEGRLYTRRRHSVALAGGSEQPVWVYEINEPRGRVVASGDWLNPYPKWKPNMTQEVKQALARECAWLDQRYSEADAAASDEDERDEDEWDEDDPVRNGWVDSRGRP
jgi:gamma-glutamylcyclotransferase (GGCT)/AIG2-like uncharacterized protein YtfP